MPAPPRRPWLGVWLAALAAAAGCARADRDALVVLTNWTEAECEGLDRSSSITWVRLAPGDDPTRHHGRRDIDILLGGPVWSYRRLPTGISWRVARRARLGLGWDRAAWEARGLPAPGDDARLGSPALAGLVAWDDPRRDPIALAWARAKLASGPWVEGYADLVLASGNARRIAPRVGSSRDDLRRGVVLVAPLAGPAPGLDFLPMTGAPEWIEGVAIAPGTRRPEAARAFLARFETATEGGPESHSRVDPLLADLLGATLVDAQDELWSARESLARSGRPGRWAAWMVEPPTWPPASIEKLKAKGDLALIDTLARQLAPDVEQRLWLIASWDGPPSPIDGRRLDELAGAVGGRLGANPRFRAWLRGEWRAWARQRYRRVARQAETERS